MTIVVPSGPQYTSRSIRLDTAQGTAIENYQISEISNFEQSQFAVYDKWQEGRVLRAGPTGQYNCHGLSFATRRTGIYDRTEVEKILHEDGYREIHPSKALPGDVILYLAEDGDAEHSGLVVSAPDKLMLGVPQVISKWGKYSEFIHWANQCPYSFANSKYYRIAISNAK